VNEEALAHGEAVVPKKKNIVKISVYFYIKTITVVKSTEQ